MIRRQLCITNVCMLSIGMILISGCDKKDKNEAEKKTEKSEDTKESKELTDETLEKVLETDVAGFEEQPGGQITKVMGLPLAEKYYKGTKANEHEMTAFVRLRIHGCGHCPELTASAFEAEEHLYEKMNIPAVHKENPDAVFEIKEDTIAGKKVVTVYNLSFFVSEDGKTRTSAHGFSVYHHNGETMLHIGVSARAVKGFKSVEGFDDLKNRFTREEMKGAATVFVQTFAPKLF